MADNALFLDIESDNYHLQVFDPNSTSLGDSTFPSQQTILNFKSKQSGALLSYIDLHRAATRFVPECASYLRQAQRLDGDALDAHLSGFLPLNRIDIKQFPQYALETVSQEVRDATPLTLASLANRHFSTPQAYSVLDAFRSLKEELPRCVDGKDVDPEAYAQAQHTLDEAIDHYAHRADPRMRINPASHLFTLTLALKKLDIYDIPNTTPAFRDALTYLNGYSDKQQQERFITDIASPWLLGPLAPDHPVADGLRRMTFGETPLVSRDELDASAIFSGARGYGPSIENGQWAPRPNTAITSAERYQRGAMSTLINFISQGATDEARRNAFQFFRAFDYTPSVLTSTSLTPTPLKEYAPRIYRGDSPARLLKQVLTDPLRPDDASEVSGKLGKRETHILTHNMREFERIKHAGLPGDLKTLEGETLSIGPLPRGILTEDNSPWAEEFKARATERYATATLYDAQGEERLHGTLNLDNLRIGAPALIVDLPRDTLTRPYHLKALEIIDRNQSLTQKLMAGRSLLRDGAIKKSQHYRGVWQSITHLLDQRLEGNETHAVIDDLVRRDPDLLRYLQDTFVRDGETIVDRVGSALVMHYLNAADIDTDPVHANAEGILNVSRYMRQQIRLYDTPHQIHCSQTQFLDPLSRDHLNYNRLIDLAEECHKGFAPLKKVAGPAVSIETPPCLPPVELTLPSGETLTITALGRYEDIIQEGQTMNHCVGTYAADCMAGRYAVFSVCLEGEPVATLGMDVEWTTLSFDQLQGYANSDVAPDVRSAVMDFANHVEANNAYDNYPVVIDTSTLADINLNKKQLLALQFEFDIESEDKMAQCREFLVDKLGEEATHALLHDAVSEARKSTVDAAPDPAHAAQRRREFDAALQRIDADFAQRNRQATLSSEDASPA